MAVVNALRAQIIGIKQLRARLDAVKTNKGVLRLVAQQGVKEAKLIVPRKTANLARTIRVGTVTDTSATVVAGGTTEVGYAIYVERGTRPHVIRSRPGGPSLAWGGKRTLSGRSRKGSKPTHFARSVRHPGTRARPYLVPGVRRALRQAGLRKAIVKAWDEAA